MKFINSFIIFSFLFHIEGCKEAELTPNERTEELLIAHAWQMTEVKIDGIVSDLYSGLTLSFGSKTYTSTNGGKVWLASGTWEFVGDNGDKILRDDGLEVIVESLTESQLVLSFTWNSTTFDGGRVGSLKGFHKMSFK